MLKNDQTFFKNLAVFTLKYVWPFFKIVCDCWQNDPIQFLVCGIYQYDYITEDYAWLNFPAGKIIVQS